MTRTESVATKLTKSLGAKPRHGDRQSEGGWEKRKKGEGVDEEERERP